MPASSRRHPFALRLRERVARSLISFSISTAVAVLVVGSAGAAAAQGDSESSDDHAAHADHAAHEAHAEQEEFAFGDRAESAAHDDHASHGGHGVGAEAGLQLSQDLRDLLRAEMLEVESAMAELLPAVSSGDWGEVARLGEGIEASFVLKRSLTPQLVEEIHALPGEFLRLDGRFHATAAALARAGEAGDSELAVFYTSRLIEGCVGCHGRFARERFPGFE